MSQKPIHSLVRRWLQKSLLKIPQSYLKSLESAFQCQVQRPIFSRSWQATLTISQERPLSAPFPKHWTGLVWGKRCMIYNTSYTSQT